MRLLLLLLAALLTAAEPEPRVLIRTNHGDITCELFASECPLTVATFLGLAEGGREFTGLDGKPAKRPYYDGLTFHRIVPGFMIQGGDLKGDGTGGPGFTFADEINPEYLGLDAKALLGNSPHPWIAYPQAMASFRELFLRPKLTARGLGPNATPAEQQAVLPAVLAELADVTLRDVYTAMGYRYDPKLPPSHPPVRGSLAMANSGPNTNGSQFFINLGDTPHLRGKHTVFGRVVAGFEVAQAIANVAKGENDRPLEAVVIQSIRRIP